jgi:hypothetical protein
MVTKHQIVVTLMTLALAGAGALPARAADEPAPAAEAPAPAAEAPAAPVPDVVKAAKPVAKATKRRVVRHRVVRARFWHHHPIRVASEAWSRGGGYHWAVSHVVLGVGF